MATISGEMFCCDDCASSIANDDSSAFDLYGPEVREAWEKGVSENGAKLDGMPVINCPEDCEGGDKQEFNCDFCGRNVYSHKFELVTID